MADIELVIKIPNGAYNLLKTSGVDWLGAEHILNAVANGTPLPKGHGRLIDADVFEKRLMAAKLYYIREKANDFDLRFAAGLKSAAKKLVDAPTIIESDKEE